MVRAKAELRMTTFQARAPAIEAHARKLQTAIDAFLAERNPMKKVAKLADVKRLA